MTREEAIDIICDPHTRLDMADTLLMGVKIGKKEQKDITKNDIMTACLYLDGIKCDLDKKLITTEDAIVSIDKVLDILEPLIKAEDAHKSAVEKLDEIAVPSTPEEIRSRYRRRFMHKAEKCAKQAWAIAGNDEDFVRYFNELMEDCTK